MPVHYGSNTLNNVTVSSPLSKQKLIQLLKFLKQLVLATLSELLNKTRWQLVIWEKVQLVRVIFQQPSISQQPYVAKHYSYAETINMPSQPQFKTNISQMVLCREQYHLGLQAPGLMEMTLWQFYMLLKKLEDISSKKENLTFWSL